MRVLEAQTPAASLDDLTLFVDEPDSRPRVDTAELETGSGVRALFVRQAVGRGTPLIEYAGEVTTPGAIEASLADAGGSAAAPCPFVWLAPKQGVAIDSRTKGNPARFVRRSCKPTAKVVTYQAHQQHMFVLTAVRELSQVSGGNVLDGHEWA